MVVDVTFPNGKRYRRMVGTKKQAEEIERRMEQKITERKWELKDTDITFYELLPEYLEYAKASKSEKTYSIDKYRIEAHLLPYFADTPIKSITPQMIDNYKSKRVREEASNNTINHELANLSHIQVLRLPFSGSSESFKARIRHVTENNIGILHKNSLVLSLQSK